MEGKILLQDIADALSLHNNLSKKEADVFTRTFFDVIKEGLRQDKVVKIKGLGTFKLVTVNSRQSVDVTSGERIEIKEHSKISFVPDSGISALINKPFAQFETVTINDDVDLDLMEDVTHSPLSSVPSADDSEPVTNSESGESTEFKHPEGNEEDAVVLSKTDEEQDGVTDAVAIVPFVDAAKSQSAASENSEVSDENIKLNDAAEDNHIETETKEVETVDAAIDDSSDNLTPAEAQTNECGPDKELNNDDNKPSDAQKIEAQATDHENVQGQEKKSEHVEQQMVERQTVHHQTIEHQRIVVSDLDKYNHHRKLRWLTVVLGIILGCVLLAGAYIAGNRNLFTPHKVEVTPMQPLTVANDSDSIEGTKNEVAAEKDTLRREHNNVGKDTVNAVAQKSAGNNSEVPVDKDVAIKKYPQLPGGKYLIVGTRGTHVIKKGESLMHLAKEVYGSKGYAPYIIVYNRITDADHIEVGSKLKLPTLQRK
jgi:nucleoid DNA-binding protein/nucleoid-associated protein YgaU